MQYATLDLGDTVTDLITGFTGVVVGIVYYISGCNQALVVPTVDADGKLRDGSWFDVQRLVIMPEPRIVLDNGNTPGCDIAPDRSY